MEEIKNKKKRELINQANNIIVFEFGDLKPEELTPEKISHFIEKVNPYIQNYAHMVVKGKQITSHVERKLIKNKAKLIIFQELVKKYPDQIIEYLFRKSYKINFREKKKNNGYKKI